MSSIPQSPSSPIRESTLGTTEEDKPIYPTIEAAIAGAIKQGQAAADDFQSTFDALRHELKRAIDVIHPWQEAIGEKGEGAASSALSFTSRLEKRCDEIQTLFNRQRKYLATVNITFFGRTGVGKSSLIEALSHGDGESVSRGESDWTVEVRRVKWNGCELLDTPGINGWGRTKDPGCLEDQARQAVEIADIVLLCFDTQSQQETEFKKVAEWIQAYGKPTIAVLNCRNQRWRVPARVEFGSQRRAVSEAVRQHQGNICDELQKLGLPYVPVIAISAKRALIARCHEPFQGPDAVTFQKQRLEYGLDRLFKWSNLLALENLISTALERDAPGIRLGMLVANLRGVLSNIDVELERMGSDAEKLSEAMDSTVDGLLHVLGYPQNDVENRAPFGDPRLSVDMLTRLEQLRGGQYQAASEGEFQTFCAQMLSSYLGKLRSQALEKAEEFVLAAFNERRETTAEEFDRKVYYPKETDAVAKQVLEHCGEFLKRKVKLVIRDSQTDLTCLISESLGLQGNSGKGWRRFATLSRVTGILSGATSTTLLALAALDFWNPGGWVLAVVAVGGGLISWLGNWSGKKAEKVAEARRNRARREALLAARKSVNQTFDTFTDKVAGAAAECGRATMAAALTPPLREAVVSKLIAMSSCEARTRFAGLREALPSREPQRILSDAARHLQDLTYPSNPRAAKLIWLGEDWIEDPEGLTADSDSWKLVQKHKEPSFGERLMGLIGAFFARTTSHPRVGDGDKWLRLARTMTTEIDGLTETFTDLDNIIHGNRPRVHLIGDYNTGKTSFIKRLLIESGQPLPNNLMVGGNPTTAEVGEFEWEGTSLVDTPGLQSTRPGDTELALQVCADSSFLLCLLQPNLLGSSIDLLTSVLKGNEKRALAPKLKRALFIINRSDELGIDPADDPDEYLRLCRRKQSELFQALSRRQITFDMDNIVCMASDPYGLVGDRRDVNMCQYDKFREWDGFAAFVHAVRSMKKRAMRTGIDVSVLEGGMARLGTLRITQRTMFQNARNQKELFLRLEDLLRTSAAEGKRILAHIESRLDLILDEATQGYLSDALGATNEAELIEASKTLNMWWNEKTFQEDVEHWEKESRDHIDRWFTRIQDEMGRRIMSPEFARVFPGSTITYDSSALGPNQGGRNSWWNFIESAARTGGRRDVIYDIGKFFGQKFRPWGAVKVAARFAKVAAILGAVGAGLDIFDFVRSRQATEKREQARIDAAKFLRESSEEVRKSLFGGDDSATGPCAYLAGHISNLGPIRESLHQSVLGKEKEENMLNKQLDTLNDLIADARKRLGLPKEAENANV